MNLVNSGLLRHMLGAVLGVAGQHGGDNAQFLDPGYYFHGIVLQRIRDHNVADERSVSGNQHLGTKSGFLISGQVNVILIHQFAVAAQQCIGSGFRLDAMEDFSTLFQRTTELRTPLAFAPIT